MNNHYYYPLWAPDDIFYLLTINTGRIPSPGGFVLVTLFAGLTQDEGGLHEPKPALVSRSDL
jgi:hypothetical protein